MLLLPSMHDTRFDCTGICYWAHGRIARWVKRRPCDVGEAKEGLENELWRRWSNGRVGEWAVTYVKRRKSWRMSFDVALLILQLLRHFTYVTPRSPILPSLYVRHSSFSNTSVASPSSQLILQPFFPFSYATGSSLMSPGEPPMMKSIPRQWLSFMRGCMVSVGCNIPQ